MIKIKSLFKKKQRRCAVMDGLQFRSIPVNYPTAIVQGVVRPARTKVWNVAVRTVEPETTFPSHSAWQLSMMLERNFLILHIANLESLDLLYDASRYRTGVRLTAPVLMPNT